jgi:hypothetical protein
MDGHAEMNAAIVAGVTRGDRLTTGALARLAGGQPQEESPRARLSRLVAASADARQAGDEIALAVAEHAIDKLIADTRAARTEQPRDDQVTGSHMGDADHSGEPSDFGGGVRRQPRPSPGIGIESANDLLQRALSASRAERRERGADETVIVGNW